MKKTEIFCDGCDKIVDTVKLGSFYSGKYEQNVDLCQECVDLLIEYQLKTASILRFCKKCRGSGTVDGERIDSPCCGENRPEYRQEKCECCKWREK